MCGRFALTSNASTLNAQFDTEVFVTLTPRFNIAPSHQILAIRTRSHHQRREPVLLKWGLVPSWADDPSIGARLTNARAETAATKPSFRTSFYRQRCLIPADGFYEWSNIDGKKQPYYIHLQPNEPFALGGLWDTWERKGVKMETCTILTCSANQAMQHLHPRMPVGIQPERYDAWLDPATELKDCSQDLLPFPKETTVIFPVSDYVNDVRHDDVRCQQQFSDGNPAHAMHNAQLPTASQKLLFEK